MTYYDKHEILEVRAFKIDNDPNLFESRKEAELHLKRGNFLEWYGCSKNHLVDNSINPANKYYYLPKISSFPRDFDPKILTDAETEQLYGPMSAKNREYFSKPHPELDYPRPLCESEIKHNKLVDWLKSIEKQDYDLVLDSMYTYKIDEIFDQFIDTFTIDDGVIEILNKMEIELKMRHASGIKP